MNKYYAMTENGNTLEIYIYGDITSWPWITSDVSSKSIVDQLKDSEADNIVVKINSYGGEVGEALAIYNELKEKIAEGITVTTMNMGFACSAASLIFCAGTHRLMAKNSLLMIHNPWTNASGNVEQLRKAADTLDKITGAVKSVYADVVSVDEDTLKDLLDNETWIAAQDAVSYGLATGEIVNDEEQSEAVAKVKSSLFNMILNKKPESKMPEPKLQKPPKEKSNFEKMFSKFKGE